MADFHVSGIPETWNIEKQGQKSTRPGPGQLFIEQYAHRLSKPRARSQAPRSPARERPREKRREIHQCHARARGNQTNFAAERASLKNRSSTQYLRVAMHYRKFAHKSPRENRSQLRFTTYLNRCSRPNVTAISRAYA